MGAFLGLIKMNKNYLLKNENKLLYIGIVVHIGHGPA